MTQPSTLPDERPPASAPLATEAAERLLEHTEPPPTKAANEGAPPIIQVEAVNRTFAKNVGVFDLTFQIPSGIIFGLIGPSGCGKTTTVRLLTGVQKPDSGDIDVLGMPPVKFDTRTRESIGYMPQSFVLYPHLTVIENLNFAASLYGVGFLKRRKRIKDLLEFVELSDARTRLTNQLSGGMQRRLALASTLVHEPQLIFADEPTAGIDPVLRGKFWEYFRALRDEGKTLFITTQYVGEAAYCDMIGVMRAGRLLFIDTPDGLRRRAFGGEMIKLVVAPDQTLDAILLLQRHEHVTDVRRSRSDAGTLFVYTTRAAESLPLLLTLLKEDNDIDVQQAERYLPPFDDVFIALMEKSGETNV